MINYLSLTEGQKNDFWNKGVHYQMKYNGTRIKVYKKNGSVVYENKGKKIDDLDILLNRNLSILLNAVKEFENSMKETDVFHYTIFGEGKILHDNYNIQDFVYADFIYQEHKKIYQEEFLNTEWYCDSIILDNGKEKYIFYTKEYIYEKVNIEKLDKIFNDLTAEMEKFILSGDKYRTCVFQYHERMELIIKNFLRKSNESNKTLESNKDYITKFLCNVNDTEDNVKKYYKRYFFLFFLNSREVRKNSVIYNYLKCGSYNKWSLL